LLTCGIDELANQHEFDAVIVGGGIAGLWLLNRLCNTGFNAILLESDALGSHQTIASQGMIHGGIKYTLGGGFTSSSEAVAAMPDHWQQCLQGEGDVDLTAARLLSDHFYLWSTADLKSRVGGFLASKITRGRVEPVPPQERPTLFRQSAFEGRLYRLVDKVIDTGSVVRALAENYPDRIYAVSRKQCQWQAESGGYSLAVNGHHLVSSAFIFAAGTGNEELLAQVGAIAPMTQRRPLQQVMVRHNLVETFYGHCIALEKTPRLTISSHPMADSSQVWYLGGNLAEQGAGMSPRALIALARTELTALLPWVDLGDAQWATFAIDRAEPRQAGFGRPDDAVACWVEGNNCSNLIAAWPTKLTLAPRLAAKVESMLIDKRIVPGNLRGTGLPFPKPDYGKAPWQEAFDCEPA
jgi:FAD dependent oxidoreductase